MTSNITTMIYNDPLLTESPTPTPMHTAKNSLESEPPNLQRLRNAAHENGQREREIDVGDESVIRYHENLHKESFVPSTVQYTHLAAYFIFNLVLTIYNKIVLQKFPLPYLLTTLHAACGCLGCVILRHRGCYTVRRLAKPQFIVMLLFSTLYTFNIAISNVSLTLVTIPFHQIVRATSPIFTILLCVSWYGKAYSRSTYLSMVPIIVGVGFATYGDYQCTTVGFFLTLFGAFLASLKTVITNRLQTGPLQLSAFEILHYMSPLAMIQSLIFAEGAGELDAFYKLAFIDNKLSVVVVALLLFNGAIAFGLNIISFTANKNTGPLTMTVAANVKQILTIMLGIVFFKLHVGLWNGFGMAITVIGGACYAKVEVTDKVVWTSTLPQYQMSAWSAPDGHDEDDDGNEEGEQEVDLGLPPGPMVRV